MPISYNNITCILRYPTFLYYTAYSQVHLLSSFIYSGILKYCYPSWFNERTLIPDLFKKMFLISILFSINIVLANYSLQYCSLALDQVISISLCNKVLDGSLYCTCMDSNSSILYYWRYHEQKTNPQFAIDCNWQCNGLLW